jgi:hypothetical protein
VDRYAEALTREQLNLEASPGADVSARMHFDPGGVRAGTKLDPSGRIDVVFEITAASFRSRTQS